jgi:BioD-like phosphotransacetylase family protein
MRRNAGKTSVIIGLARVLQKQVGYMKPFGERLLYRKKRLWDYDAALMVNLFNIVDNPEDMSIGFHHSKLLYMLDKDSTRERIIELAAMFGRDKDLLFVEGGRDLSYGVSIHLDPISVASYLDAPLLIVAGGEEDMIMDDLSFLKKYVPLNHIDFKGIIINRIPNPDDFRDVQLPKIMELGFPILGVIPYRKELMYFSVRYLAERLFAKILTGEGQVDRPVKHIFIGAMSVSVAMQSPHFAEESKLVITSGDRSDMIVAALESKCAAIILTNNITPAPNLISQAERFGVPVLLVPADMYETANHIDRMEPLPTRDDLEKIRLITELIQTHVDVKGLFSI